MSFLYLVDSGKQKQEAGEQGQGRAEICVKGTSQETGCRGYRGAGEFRAHLSLSWPFSPPWPTAERKRKDDRGCAQQAEQQQQQQRQQRHPYPVNLCSTLGSQGRYVQHLTLLLVRMDTPPPLATHTQAAITETGPVTATGERQGARNYG